MNQAIIKKKMAAKIRMANLEALIKKTEADLRRLEPFIKEANQATTLLKRKFNFMPKMKRRIDPVTKVPTGRVDLVVMVTNTEDGGYSYEWTVDKFNNRLGLIRDYIEDYQEND